MRLPPLPRALLALRAPLWEELRQSFVLDWTGDHGAAHWSRVARHARELAAAMSVNPTVPVLFAWLHDSQRENEYDDPEHGERASIWAQRAWQEGRLPLDDAQARHLFQAMAGHSDGLTQGPLIVQVCWDADRLDLGRVGITPDPSCLCTPAAREPERIARALAWSRGQSLQQASFEDDGLPKARRPHW